MLNPFQLLDPWMLIGGAAMLLLVFLAVFVWNSPRRRQSEMATFPVPDLTERNRLSGVGGQTGER